MHFINKCFSEKEGEDRNGCTFKYKDKFSKKNLNDQCAEYCPLECDSLSYSTTTSFHWTESLNISSTLKFKIYFKELKYTLISQQPQMNLSDLISGIGGILGLFLGLSFLSFVEILEIGFQIIYFAFALSRNPNRIKVIKFDEFQTGAVKSNSIKHSS